MFEWLCNLNTTQEPEIIELTREQMNNYPQLFMMHSTEYNKVFKINTDTYDTVLIKTIDNRIFTTSIDNMIHYAEQNYNHPFIFQIGVKLPIYSLIFYRVINSDRLLTR